MKPELLWKCFDEVTKIPRPSCHEEKIREFLVDFAKKHGIEVKTDKTGNVVMSKPATPGHENAPTVVLQAHMDMVAEKNNGVEHDFLTDPIETYVDGEWVKAKGTTLGADNGIGVAAGMAVMIDDSLVHGPLQALFTVNEEIGLEGAQNISADMIKGDILLNLDSEEMGQLVIGCAGGKVTECRLPYTLEETPSNYESLKVSLSGLKGGHSGMEIGLGRANANQQLARVLWEADAHVTNVEVSEIDGGNLANAIPRDAHAVVAVSRDAVADFERFINDFNRQLHSEFDMAENHDFQLKVEKMERRPKVIESSVSHRLIAALYCCPNGVQGMSLAIEGLIETSCNLASVKMVENDTILITVHQRSSVDSRRDEIADRISALFGMIGADVTFDDAYVGWSPNPQSKVLKVAEASYRDLFGKEAKVEALHAGLETGLFLEKMPHLDMISFGPTLKNIHSPSERANIQSVAEFYRLLKEIITRLAN